MPWQMTSADDVADDVTRVDVNRRKQACAGVWWHVAVRGARDQPYRNFERHVGARVVSNDVESFTVL